MPLSKFDKQTGRDKFFEKMEKELKAITDPSTGEIYADITKKVPCPLCNKDDYKLLFKKQGFYFVRCNDCGVIYVNPQIIEEKIINFYKKDSNANKFWIEVLLSPTEIKLNNKKHRMILNSLSKYVEKGRLLDVGCSFGHFLKDARERGYDVRGIELENEAVKYAREKFGLKIQQKTLSQCNFEKEKFDVVTALAVLEHVANPLKLLREIRQILKPEGILYLEMPNVESLACAILHEKARTFTGRNHLTYFSLTTLTAILEKAGFKVLSDGTFISCLDSILNGLQFLDPFAKVELKFLPNKIREIIKNEEQREKLEQLIFKLGLGYRMRVFAQKI